MKIFVGRTLLIYCYVLRFSTICLPLSLALCFSLGLVSTL